MTYVIGAVCGLVFGAAAGMLKYILLWRPLQRGTRPCDQKHLLVTQGVSMAVNVAVLFSVYFLRHILPFSFEATLIAAAVGLSLMGRLSPLRDLRLMEKLSAAEQEKQDG